MLGWVVSRECEGVRCGGSVAMCDVLCSVVVTVVCDTRQKASNPPSTRVEPNPLRNTAHPHHPVHDQRFQHWPPHTRCCTR